MIYLFSLLVNLSLTISLTFGGMMLVQPVTNRVLRPRQRAVLWYLGWHFLFFFNLFGVLGYLPLHITFRSFLSSRTHSGSAPIPAFVPDFYDGPGQYNLSLPGNRVIRVTLTDDLMAAVLIIWAAGMIAVLLWRRSQKRKLRALEREGEEVSLAQLGVDDPELKTMYFEKITPRIFLCDGLPTSYVRDGFWANEFYIYLQRELPPQRLSLVLRHELKHIQLHHVRYKSVAHITLVLYWWSPLVWLAFRVLCRDMELACDEAVMDSLDETGRREYARTIAELGAGRPLWESAATFGECDAKLRVRQTASWKKMKFGEKALSWAAFVLLFVFFYCGSPAGDGILAADHALAKEKLLSQDVAEVPVISLYSSSPYLDLAEIWTDPDSDNVYGLNVHAKWWRFQLGYFPRSGKFYIFSPFQIGGAPELSGLERLK